MGAVKISYSEIFPFLRVLIRMTTVTLSESGPRIPTEGEFMTKADLIDRVVSLGDLTRRDGEVIVETLFDAVVEALKANDKVEVRGFGSFRTRQRNPRTGRNPKTGASVAVPAKRVPYFKPSKELRDLVYGSGKSEARGEQHAHVDPHHPPAM
jgi:integration host factor subunit beta